MQSQTPLGRLLLSVFVRSRHRPTDNNLKWWKSYVAEFFAPTAVLRLTELGRAAPVHHEIPFALMPRFFQIKYSTHLREEWLFTGHYKELRDTAGMQLGCQQALEHSVFDTYVMVKCGQLRVLFSAQMHIVVYEFRVTMMENFICKQVCQHVEHELHALTQLMEQTRHVLQSPSAAPYSAADALQAALDKVKSISDVFHRQAAAQAAYSHHLTLVAGIADAVGTMGDLMDATLHHAHTPLSALRQYGTLSAHLAHTPGLLPPPGHPRAATPPGGDGSLPSSSQAPLGLPAPPGHNHNGPPHSNGPSLAPAGSASRPLPQLTQQQQQQQHMEHLMMGSGGGVSGGLPPPQRQGGHPAMAMTPPLMVPHSPNLPHSAASSPMLPLHSQPMQPSSSAAAGHQHQQHHPQRQQQRPQQHQQQYIDRGRLLSAVQAAYSPQTMAPPQGGNDASS